MSDPGFQWRVTLKRRLVVAAGFMAVWVAGIEARLVYLQIFRHADLTARAARQQSDTLPTPAKRGDILDRRGHLLATSVDADSIYAVPSEIDNGDETVAKLCDALGDCSARDRDALTERLKNQRSHFAYVRRQVSPEAARRVAALNLQGVGFIKESRRFYPNKELGRAPARLRRRRRQRARRARVGLRLADSRQGRDGPDSHRRPAARLQPLRAAADGRLDHRVDDRRVPAARRGARAARGRRRRIAPKEARPSS